MNNNPEWIVGVARLIRAGGARKQIFTKTGDNDYEVGWEDAHGRNIPAGDAFPTSPTPHGGDLFRLQSHEDVPQDRVLPVTQAQASLREIALGAGPAGLPHYIYGYAPGVTGPNQVLANKVYVTYSGARTKTASKLIFHSDKNTQQTFTVSQTNQPGFQHWYRVSDLTYADLQTTRRYFVNIEFTDGTKLYPDAPFDRGLYAYSDTRNVWEPAVGAAAWWATVGRPEPRTLLALTQLIDGPATGISVASANTASRTPGAPVLFHPNNEPTEWFELNEDENSHGLIEIEATLSFSTRSALTIGFTNEGLQSQRKTGYLFSSSVRSSTVYSASAQNGVRVNTWNVWDTDGLVHVGDIELYIARNANNRMGYYFYYKVASGGGSRNFGLSATMEVAFLHNDGADAPQEFTGLTDTPTSYTGQAGKILQVNTGETALEFTDKPAGSGGGLSASQVNGAIDARVDGFARNAGANNDQKMPASNLAKPTLVVSNSNPIDKSDDVVPVYDESSTNWRQASFADIKNAVKPNASEVDVDATGFDGVLGTGDNTVQKIAQKLDDYVPRNFSITRSPHAHVNAYSNTSGGWGAFAVITTSPNLTAAQAGRVLIVASFDGVLTTSSTGGGDRVLVALSIIRNRGVGNAAIIAKERRYIRNQSLVNAGAANSSQDYVDATKTIWCHMTSTDVAQSGDNYYIQARIIAQVNANAHTLQFPSTGDNKLTIIGF